ncbi:MAG: YggT family protein [Peptostreptococcaceae bacterium]
MNTIAVAMYHVLDIVSWIIVIKSFLTWVPNETTERLYDILSVITEPIEAPIRSLTSKFMNGPVDLTPMFAIILLMMLKNIMIYLM